MSFRKLAPLLLLVACALAVPAAGHALSPARIALDPDDEAFLDKVLEPIAPSPAARREIVWTATNMLGYRPQDWARVEPQNGDRPNVVIVTRTVSERCQTLELATWRDGDTPHFPTARFQFCNTPEKPWLWRSIYRRFAPREANTYMTPLTRDPADLLRELLRNAPNAPQGLTVPSRPAVTDIPSAPDRPK